MWLLHFCLLDDVSGNVLKVNNVILCSWTYACAKDMALACIRLQDVLDNHAQRQAKSLLTFYFGTMRRRRKAFYILISVGSLEGGSHKARPTHSAAFVIYIIDDCWEKKKKNKPQSGYRKLIVTCNKCIFILNLLRAAMATVCIICCRRHYPPPQNNSNLNKTKAEQEIKYIKTNQKGGKK